MASSEFEPGGNPFAIVHNIRPELNSLPFCNKFQPVVPAATPLMDGLPLVQGHTRPHQKAASSKKRARPVDDERANKLERNRIAAKKSREKKKARIAGMGTDMKQTQRENAQLRSMVSQLRARQDQFDALQSEVQSLRAENTRLRQAKSDDQQRVDDPLDLAFPDIIQSDRPRLDSLQPFNMHKQELLPSLDFGGSDETLVSSSVSTQPRDTHNGSAESKPQQLAVSHSNNRVPTLRDQSASSQHHQQVQAALWAILTLLPTLAALSSMIQHWRHLSWFSGRQTQTHSSTCTPSDNLSKTAIRVTSTPSSDGIRPLRHQPCHRPLPTLKARTSSCLVSMTSFCRQYPGPPELLSPNATRALQALLISSVHRRIQAHQLAERVMCGGIG